MEIIEGLHLENFSLDEDFAIIEEQLRNDPQKDYTASRGEYLNGEDLWQSIWASNLSTHRMSFSSTRKAI